MTYSHDNQSNNRIGSSSLNSNQHELLPNNNNEIWMNHGDNYYYHSFDRTSNFTLQDTTTAIKTSINNEFSIYTLDCLYLKQRTNAYDVNI